MELTFIAHFKLECALFYKAKSSMPAVSYHYAVRTSLADSVTKLQMQPLLATGNPLLTLNACFIV